jgi:phosphoribosylformimino-5-aminoimidazole carboxamide ribotide isomerase
MEILPAIDLREGKVVRLLQGDFARQTTYSDDPAAVARDFVASGAMWIHMVDLDAARTGRRTNIQAIQAVRQAVQAQIQLGGGARDDASLEAMLAIGVDRVVVGSAALGNWKWFEKLLSHKELAGKVALGLDARGGKLAVRGWTRQVEETPVELARRVRGWPLGAIVYTDIARDGLLEGVNLTSTAELIAATDVPVIASGGVGGIQDIAGCKGIGCAGVIIGKAYYEGKVDLRAACELAAK